MTPMEAKLWVALRRLRPAGFHVRRQVPIGPYVTDFACLKARLVMEVDGSGHGRPATAVEDRARDDLLRARGFRVVRFWNDQVHRDLDSVMDTVYAHLTTCDLDSHPPRSCLPGGAKGFTKRSGAGAADDADRVRPPRPAGRNALQW